jgi:ribosomal-protein-alanine N-acetyltransferase
MSRESPGTGITLRAFELADIPGVCELVAASPGAAQWPTSVYGEMVHPPNAAFVVAGGSGVLGFIAIRAVADDAEILNLAVVETHRRRGLASGLLRMAETRARALGAGALFLEVRESNLAAICLYVKHGFVRSGRRVGYYREPDEAALIMEKKLSDFPA